MDALTVAMTPLKFWLPAAVNGDELTTPFSNDLAMGCFIALYFSR
jgi:hypothetical protein